MGHGGDWYYNSMESSNERKNKVPGFLILVIIMVATIALLRFIGNYFGDKI